MAKKKFTELSEIIAWRRNQALEKEDVLALLRRIFFLAVTAWLLFSQIFQFVRIEGVEMFPSLKDGDLAIVFRWQQNYEKGDVVAYRYNGELRVGRLVAKETDIVHIKEEGNLYVNGTIQGEDLMYPTYGRDDVEYPIEIPQKHVYIMGDYRTRCLDSRDYGPIRLDDVEGKVISILRRRGL